MDAAKSSASMSGELRARNANRCSVGGHQDTNIPEELHSAGAIVQNSRFARRFTFLALEHLREHLGVMLDVA